MQLKKYRSVEIVNNKGKITILTADFKVAIAKLIGL